MKSDLDLTVQQQLIAEFKENPQVFEKIYEHYYEIIFKYLLKRTLNSEVAYDLTAETFIKAYQSLGKFKWMGFSLKIWLFRIAINNLKNYRRRPETFAINEEIEGHESLIKDAKEELKELDEKLFGDDQLSKLSDAIGTLKPDYQNIVSLYYFDEMSQQEIADTVGKSVSAVKSIMHRAITNLREILQPNEA